MGQRCPSLTLVTCHLYCDERACVQVEAGGILQEGVAIKDLDRALKRFGFPVGPATLFDEVRNGYALALSIRGERTGHRS